MGVDTRAVAPEEKYAPSLGFVQFRPLLQRRTVWPIDVGFKTLFVLAADIFEFGTNFRRRRFHLRDPGKILAFVERNGGSPPRSHARGRRREQPRRPDHEHLALRA